MSYNLICQKTFSRACKTFILYAEIHACVTLVTNPPSPSPSLLVAMVMVLLMRVITMRVLRVPRRSSRG